MKKLRWQILIVLLTLVVVAVLLLAQEPGQTLFVPRPAAGGVYTEGLVGSLSRLNPLLDAYNPADRDLDRLIFSGLVRFDGRGVPIPDLADSWGTTQDGKVYNFSLRQAAQWHDGEPVTSDDVIFTIDLIKAGASLLPADVVALWSEVEVVRLNEKMVQFILPEPFAPFLDYMTFGILPRHLLESIPPAGLADADFNLKPIGTGPYRLDHLIIEEGQVAGVVLTPFEKYYGEKPYIEQMVFRYYPTPAAALESYQQGEILSISQLSAEVLPQALALPNLSVYTSRLPELSLVLLNHADPQAPFLDEPAVRRALLLGINRQRLVDRLMAGQAIIADGPIFPGTWAYYEGLERVSYDPDAAIKLLKDEGYIITGTTGEIRARDGQLLEFTLLHPDDVLHAALAAHIQEDLLRIGVKVNLEPVAYDQLVDDRLSQRRFQAALVDLNLSRTPDPDPYPFWHQSEATGGQNYGQWDNRTASEYLEQARITTDLAARTRLYRNFQVIFAQDNPALLLFYPVYSFAVDAQVYGVQVPPLFDTSDRFASVSDWYLVTRRTLEREPTAQAAP